MKRRCPTALEIPDAGRRPAPALSLRTSASPVTAYFTALTPSGCSFPPEATRILPRLYISDLHTAESAVTYRALGITHVVSAMQGPVVIPAPPSPAFPPTPTSPTTPIPSPWEDHLDNDCDGFGRFTSSSNSSSSSGSTSKRVTLPPAHLQLPLSDQPFSELAAYLPTSTAFIASALTDPNACVLVHCVKGISRSVSVVVAYLIASQFQPQLQPFQTAPEESWSPSDQQPQSFWQEPMTVSEAIDFVQSKRPVAKPNFGFITQLEEYADRVRCEAI